MSYENYQCCFVFDHHHHLVCNLHVDCNMRLILCDFVMYFVMHCACYILQSVVSIVTRI
jgi:hypothetical protein